MVTNEVKRTKLGGKMSKKQGKRQIFIHCNKKKGGLRHEFSFEIRRAYG